MGDKSAECTIIKKNDKTEKERRLGRERREEIGKRNEMIALKFQTGDDTRLGMTPDWG